MEQIFSYIDDELVGSKIRVAIPKLAQFNGNVVIFCHGCRPCGIPLMADLFCENDKLFLRLLKEGWIIGMTSYRKQGLTIRDAIADVDLLRDYICANYGLLDSNQQRYLKTVLLEGHSMGGAIVTHIAERQDGSKYDGMLAVGAALLVRESDENNKVLHFRHSPRLPIIYLTNSDETHIIEEYIENARENNSSVLPSLYVVYRNGHDNVNDEERIKAFTGLMNWINHNTYLPITDVTTIIQPKSNPEIFFDDEGIWAKIISTDAWGDIVTNLEPYHLLKIGINYGDHFKVEFGGKRFSHRGTQLSLVYGANSFLSVNQGELFAFDEAKGFISMSANGYAKVAKLTDLAGIREEDWIRVLRPIGVGAALTGIPGGILASRAFEQIVSM